MDLGLKDRVVLIVGATRGIGAACARLLSTAEGAKVALVSRTTAELEKLAGELQEKGGSVDWWAVDMGDSGAVDRVVGEIRERHGRIDALVNTVGVCNGSPDGAIGKDEFWDEAFQSVTMVAVRAARAVVPIMVEQGGGAIVNVSAMSARHYLPTIAHYSSQKIAEAHFTKNLAIQFGADGIRANAVMPGWVMSEQVEEGLQGRMKEAGISRDDAFKQWNDEIRATYCGRGGDPEEYANVIAFLISDKASYVNGAWLNVDGGSQF
jgi:3-oxoacyl-[acyl-carrier protein] reductase